MRPAPDVRLTLPARAEGVAVVRQALAGMADALDVDAAVLADMKMAVSEACTNVVVHAYDDGDGLLEVDMSADDVGLTIRVRDHGSGIQPQVRSREGGRFHSFQRTCLSLRLSQVSSPSNTEGVSARAK